MKLFEKMNAKEQVTLIAGIERHWKGYLLLLAGKLLLFILCIALLAAKYFFR